MRILILTALLLTVGFLAAADDTAPPATGTIARLIDQLGSRDYSAREEAGRALLAAGAEALPALKKATTSKDAEVRRRATQLVRQIAQKFDSVRALAPARVRLECKDMPVLEAVALLARRANVPIKIEGDRAALVQRKITLDTGETTFWEALDRLCREAGLVETEPMPEAPPPKGGVMVGTSIVITGGGRPTPRDLMKVADDSEPKPIRLTAGKPTSAPTRYAGALRIRPLPPDAKLPWSGNDDEWLLGLDLKTEPRAEWKSTFAVRITRAVDDQGQALTPLAPPVVESDNRGRGIVIINQVPIVPSSGKDEKAGPAPVRLTKGEKPAKTLREVSGTLLGLVQSPNETLVTVNDVLKSAGKTLKGERAGAVQVSEITRKDGGAIALRLQVELPPSALDDGSKLPINATVIVNGEDISAGKDALNSGSFRLVDEKGNPFKLTKATSVGIRGAATREVELLFEPADGQGSAARLLYLGRRTTLVEVPFTLKDVALPVRMMKDE